MNICKHCNQPTSEQNDYCCNGCMFAYNIINSLNLQKYYEYCLKNYGINPLKVNIIDNKLSYHEYIINKNCGDRAINLLIEGIYCGSCVWLIESTLRKNSKISSANLNMSTKRLVIEWKDDDFDIDGAIGQIFALGYKLIPFTPAAYEQESVNIEKSFLKRIAVAGLVSVAMMMIIWGVWAGNLDKSMGYYTRLITHILASMIALPAIVYCGWPFFQSAFRALIAKRSNMDLPIAIGIIVTIFISVQQMILGSAYTYFDAAISLIFFLLIGRYLDFKARNKARSFAQNLILSQPRVITLEVNNELLLIPLSKAKVGDIAFVSAGEKITADGVIIDGNTTIDESLITGESYLKKLQLGDRVICGTLNIGEPIKFRITALADDTMLGEIIKLIEIAEQSKSKYVKFADRISSYFTPIILIFALCTFILWYVFLNSDINIAILNSTALLIITCPCALGLAVPIVNIIASSKLMAAGIFIKSSSALEKLSAIDLVIFDKTGTLTQGLPKIRNLNELSTDDFKIISALATYSKHPLCKSIASGEMNELTETVKEEKGRGLVTKINGELIKLGSRQLCEVMTQTEDSQMEMWFKRGNNAARRLIFDDELRSDAKDVINYFHKNGIGVEILSGDRLNAVTHVANYLGVTKYLAEANPKQKYEYLEELAHQGKRILMIGDGLNDAAALKIAYVSMSPSTSLEITQVSSDIVFQGEKLGAIIQIYEIAQKANRLVKQNLALSLIYNLFSIPFAIAGMINPIIAAVAMSCSSLMVILNSLRLKINQKLP